MSDNFKIIILAIFDKYDFSNKAMADIHGKSMLQYVFESAKSSGANEIVIATDNARVGMAAEDFGATVCMLVGDNLKGISRLAEVADKMFWGDDTVIVNFPADAPLIPGEVVAQVAVNLMSRADSDCATLYSLVTREFAEKEETINMVVDSVDNVMYLSHLPIPNIHSEGYELSAYKCYLEVNAYRAGLLRVFRNLPESDLNQAEGIEELKLLHNGIAIHADEACASIGQRVIKEENIAKIKFLIEPERQVSK